ncbi:MAG: ABC transporter substrate-binding protein [Chloroherpetonaceae bacterium]|nr:ABC transporter substrate-binding protein [Chloroherpetonaceae bacterium]MCS7211407.1 ABC transporter substrate-binding protein [Chloroherpetonaceae bacterium]MDW8020994.1 ABC transporter substrate-binding protein [Chloroherpetonaceae bacterium]MDW8465678.1 ABC transporter substrate-binding protein [Chloroherpetonaceae bacterium]
MRHKTFLFTTIACAWLLSLLHFYGCGGSSSQPMRPKIGYVLMVRDATLEEARRGFFDALRDSGFEQGKTLEVIDQNAEGDIANLNQILDYFLAQRVMLIATNPTVATVAAVSKTQTVPICMMVSPRPDLAALSKSPSEAPKNLFGVYETLSYIDTSIALIKDVFPNAKRIGTIFNTSEPNSVNAMNRLRAMCNLLGYELIEAGITNSNESQQAAQNLLSKNIDVFFALPDNIIFSSFETIKQTLDSKRVPIVTSEVGLVKRGALFAYGADMYEWGRQAGQIAVRILRGESGRLEEVRVRKRVFNARIAETFNLPIPESFQRL